jgi:hypothetical protein
MSRVARRILQRLFLSHPINPKILGSCGVRKRFEQHYGKVWRVRCQVVYDDGPIGNENGITLGGQGDGSS